MALKRCTCDNPYMDKKYGRKVRVHNDVKTANGVMYRCVVCGHEAGDTGRKKR